MILVGMRTGPVALHVSMWSEVNWWEICTLDTEVLGLGTVDQLGADLLEGLHVYALVSNCFPFSSPW